jgi:hypothetical protein
MTVCVVLLYFYYFLQEQGGPVIHPGTGFPFRRLLPPLESRAEHSSCLLPATGQRGHSWHPAPLGPMAIYLFNVKTFVLSSSFVVPPFTKREGLNFL